MKREDLLAALRRSVTATNQGDLGALYAEDCIFYELPEPYQSKGLAGFMEFYGATFAGASDMEFRIVGDPVIEGDRAAFRWQTQMTHTGTLMGVPATGKRLTITGVDIARLNSEGKCVERWTEMNVYSVLQQLGIVPAE